MNDLLRKNEEGVALVLTLLITAILVTVIAEANYSTQVDLRIAGNFRNDLQAGYLAKSGVNIAISYLKYDLQNTETDDLTEDWAKSYPPLPVGEGSVEVKIEDENRKIDINKVVKEDGKVDEKIRGILTRMFEAVDVDVEIISAIIDWIDPDDDPLPDGAEDSYYGSLDPPYACKNLPLNTLSELHMIKGITDEVYRKITEDKYLTIYSKDGIININTVSPEVLMFLDEGIDEPMAEGIIQVREETPFGGQNWQEALRDVINNDDVYNAISPLIGVTSNAFSVTSAGQVEKVEKTIRAIIDREGGQVSYRYLRVE